MGTIEAYLRKEIDMTQQTYLVSGMTCQHCVTRVQSALSEVAGVHSVSVQLMPPRAVVQSEDAPLTALQAALANTNFKIDKL